MYLLDASLGHRIPLHSQVEAFLLLREKLVRANKNIKTP